MTAPHDDGGERRGDDLSWLVGSNGATYGGEAGAGGAAPVTEKDLAEVRKIGHEIEYLARQMVDIRALLDDYGKALTALQGRRRELLGITREGRLA